MALTKEQNAQLMADVGRIADALEALAASLGGRQAPDRLPDELDEEAEAQPTPQPQAPSDAPSEDEKATLNKWLIETAQWLNGMGVDGRAAIVETLDGVGIDRVAHIETRAQYDAVCRGVQGLINRNQGGA